MPVHNRCRYVVALAAVAALQFSACGGSSESDPAQPAEVVSNESGPATVTLTQEAAGRIGLETTAVRNVHGGRLAVPYAAIIYAPDGNTYVFTEPEPLTFVRRPVKVASIGEDGAILTHGPPAGTKAVTVGASELYGAETGVQE
jgi:hypothetical protein